MKYWAIGLVVLFASYQATAAKVITIESKITGSQEQPRVISIVPWQDIKRPQYLGDELKVAEQKNLFQPLKRDDFVNEIQYISATKR